MLDYCAKSQFSPAGQIAVVKQTNTEMSVQNNVYVTCITKMDRNICVDEWSPNWGARDVAWGCGKKINHAGLAPIKCIYISMCFCMHMHM
jgi:hypothetical protein